MKRLLIADDCESIRRALKNVFRATWEVVEAGDGAEACAMLPSVDAVITDWNMPLGGGARVLGACERLGIPVVLHSGNASAMSRTRFALFKGGSVEHVEAMLAKALSHVDKSS